MRHFSIINLLGFVVLASGCSHYHCLCGKRSSELQCPTDIRKANYWCFGEDAIFHGPCGPGEEFYGHAPTDWRAWPTSAEEWREMHGCHMISCGSTIPPDVYEEETLYAPGGYASPPPSASNPLPSFHDIPPTTNSSKSPTGQSQFQDASEEFSLAVPLPEDSSQSQPQQRTQLGPQIQVPLADEPNLQANSPMEIAAQALRPKLSVRQRLAVEELIGPMTDIESIPPSQHTPRPTTRHTSALVR